jgi:hypothetical protein
VGNSGLVPCLLKFLEALNHRNVICYGRLQEKEMDLLALLADTIVTVHFCYVGFTLGGEILILLGGLFRWRWVRNLSFRIVHLASVALVAVEAVAGAQCPLTTWEYRLRIAAGQQVEGQISFIARLARSVIFYNFPAWVFLASYVGFAILVGLTLILVTPRRSPGRGGDGRGRDSGSRVR